MKPIEMITIQHLARILSCADETLRRRIVDGVIVPDAIVRTTYNAVPVFRADRVGEIVTLFGRLPHARREITAA